MNESGKTVNIERLCRNVKGSDQRLRRMWVVVATFGENRTAIQSPAVGESTTVVHRAQNQPRERRLAVRLRRLTLNGRGRTNTSAHMSVHSRESTVTRNTPDQRGPRPKPEARRTRTSCRPAAVSCVGADRAGGPPRWRGGSVMTPRFGRGSLIMRGEACTSLAGRSEWMCTAGRGAVPYAR